MARQRMSDKKLRAINRLTGNEYISAWHRGGGDWRWVTCHLPPTGDLLNADKVNRVTGEVAVVYRDGRYVAEPEPPLDWGEWSFTLEDVAKVLDGRP